MMEFIKTLFGIGPKIDFQKQKKEGAVILDVRSKEEYKQGHLAGSLNIPLDTLQNNLGKLKKETAIITCCASGMRSSLAINILKKNGFITVFNGGGWTSLENKLKHSNS